MKFRKKPVVIEAEQFHMNTPLPFPAEAPIRYGCECGDREACSKCGKFWIGTLEGPLLVSDGDWIIKGIKGEFYPCKPDIFSATYEPVAE